VARRDAALDHRIEAGDAQVDARDLGLEVVVLELRFARTAGGFERGLEVVVEQRLTAAAIAADAQFIASGSGGRVKAGPSSSGDPSSTVRDECAESPSMRACAAAKASSAASSSGSGSDASVAVVPSLAVSPLVSVSSTSPSSPLTARFEPVVVG